MAGGLKAEVAGPGRDPEDARSVHLSGGTAGRAVRPHCPCSVKALRHPRRPDLGAPSAEEAVPCTSRLRPPPTTAAIRVAPHSPSGRASARPGRPGYREWGTRLSLPDRPHVPTATGRGSPAACPTPLHLPAPTPVRPRRRARVVRLHGGRARAVALARVREVAQPRRPSLKGGHPHPRGTRPHPRPGVPRSPDCAGPPICPPPTPR